MRSSQTLSLKYYFGLGYCFLSCTAAAIGDFTDSTLKDLEQKHQGQAWVLLLWSVECPPCYRELRSLQQLHSAGQTFRIELVATDPPSYRSEVQMVLEEFSLTHWSNWHFTASDEQQLRYQIDTQWFGELPRAYFYQASGDRQARSGVVEQEEFTEHFN